MTAHINLRRGAFRLWLLGSVLWTSIILASTLANTSFFAAPRPVNVHVKLSDTEAWDYPASWGVPRIREELTKHLAAEDQVEIDWASKLPAGSKDYCLNISRINVRSDISSDDCWRLLFSGKASLSVPTGWEDQIKPPPAPTLDVLTMAAPLALVPPVVMWVFGVALMWVSAGFKSDPQR